MAKLKLEGDNLARQEKLLNEKIDGLLEEIGGFGFYQALISFAFLAQDMPVAILLKNMSYFTKAPKEYICVFEDSDEPRSCLPEDFCNDPALRSYVPNTDLDKTYYNWVTNLDLACEPSYKIGLLGSIFFVGFVMTLILLPRLADLYGRQLIIKCGIIV